MSIEALNWAFGLTLEPQLKFTLVALANRADEEGMCYPRVRWIVLKTCFAERTVRAHLKELEARGLMAKQSQVRDDGGQSSNRYQLALLQPGLKLDPPGADSAGGGAKSAPAPAVNVDGRVQKLQGAGADSAPHKTKYKTKDEVKKPMGDKSPAPPDPRFEEAWKAYPRRSGNNPKLDALKAWAARVREGADPVAIIAGVRRYAAWCDATQKIDTEIVMRASTFFGPAKPYEQDFSIPAEVQAEAKERIKDRRCVMDLPSGERCGYEGDVSVGDGLMCCARCYQPRGEAIEHFRARVRAAKAKRLTELEAVPA